MVRFNETDRKKIWDKNGVTVNRVNSEVWKKILVVLR